MTSQEKPLKFLNDIGPFICVLSLAAHCSKIALRINPEKFFLYGNNQNTFLFYTTGLSKVLEFSGNQLLLLLPFGIQIWPMDRFKFLFCPYRVGFFSAIQKEFNKFIYAGHLHEEMFWIKILNYDLVEIGCCYSYHSGLKLVPWTVLNSFSLKPICHKNPSKFWVFYAFDLREQMF